jgi:hypothetical protein
MALEALLPMQLSFSEGQRIDLLLLQCTLVQSMMFSMDNKARHRIPLQCPKRRHFGAMDNTHLVLPHGKVHGEC